MEGAAGELEKGTFHKVWEKEKNRKEAYMCFSVPPILLGYGTQLKAAVGCGHPVSMITSRYGSSLNSWENKYTTMGKGENHQNREWKKQGASPWGAAFIEKKGRRGLKQKQLKAGARALLAGAWCGCNFITDQIPKPEGADIPVQYVIPHVMRPRSAFLDTSRRQVCEC